ncbi:fibronectin type III domain-containing protein [Puniceicoccaceae bacterium K14]|nr:fibronectin type III domain-containing protein [Puniceicoccaceae bacterium K14]
MLLLLSIAGTATSQAATASSVTQHGITWTFDQDYEVGQYVNGDWWVKGPITLTSITPGWDGTRNGTMINPSVNGNQGFDTRIKNNGYDPLLNIADDLPFSVGVNSSIMSCISKVDHVDLSHKDNPQMDTIAILTVLSAAPASGSFRPPYQGSDKSHDWNINNSWDTSFLQSIPREGLNHVPSLFSLTQRYEKPWIELKTNWAGRRMHPDSNYPSGKEGNYGRGIGDKIVEAFLSLQLDYTEQEKELLLIRLCQAGIDVYGAARLGAKWVDDGGHNLGRKMPLLLAAKVFDDSDMLELCDGSRGNNDPQQKVFQEDRQTFYVSQDDINLTRYTGDDRPRDPYTTAHLGLAEWGEKHTSDPTRDGSNWNAYYRGVNGPAYVGFALIARFMDLENDWNWPAFFDYADRYYSEEIGNAWNKVNEIRLFTAEMWDVYENGVTTTAAAPTFTPEGGAYEASQSVTLSTTTSGASIRYTLDGSEPTSTTGTAYTGAIAISEDTTLKAIAYNSDPSVYDSLVSEASYYFTPPGYEVLTDNGLFQNFDFVSQDGEFAATFNATPNGEQIDAVIGLSAHEANAYSDLAAIVRFSTAGFIEARDGDDYVSLDGVPYVDGNTYDFRLEIDILAGTYSAFVTPEGGSEKIIGLDYAFRSEQSGVTELANWGAVLLPAPGVESVFVGDFAISVDSTDTSSPSVPSGLISQNVTDSSVELVWSASTDNLAVTGYNIFKDGVLYESINGTSIVVSALSDATSYAFSVSAYDAAGNESVVSSEITVLTNTSAGTSFVIGEDFSAGASNFTVVGSGTWSVENGRYILSDPNTTNVLGVLGNMSIHNLELANDYKVEATLRLVESGSFWNDAALIFEYQDSANYYYASINESNDGNTKGIFRVVNGSVVEIVDISSTIISETDYDLAVERSGIDITVSLDGIVIATTADSTFEGGRVGLGTWNDSAEFDDLTVEDLGPRADATPPSNPTALVAMNVTTSTADLSWSASTDDVSVAGYRLYVDGSPGSVGITGTSFMITGLLPDTDYEIEVSALDAAGNESGKSSSITVSTLAEVVTQTFNIEGNHKDESVKENGQATGETGTYLRIGGGYNPEDSAGVYLFQLPTINSSDVVSSANLSFKLTRNSNPPVGNADVYGLPYRGSNQVLGSDFYSGSYGGDANATALQDDILVSSSPLGWYFTDPVGDANLATYLNQQIANGASTGDWIAIRMNSDHVGEGNYKMYGVASGVSSDKPVLTIEVNGEVLDVTAPSVPVNLQSSEIGRYEISLDWDESTDDTGVGGYRIYVDNEDPIQTVDTYITLEDLDSDTAYSVSVSAIDEAGNESATSNSIIVTTEVEFIVENETLVGDDDDIDLLENGSVTRHGQTSLRIGGGHNPNDSNAVLYFELPELSSGAEITDASLLFEIKSVGGVVGNADLYGIPYMSSASIPTSYFYSGVFDGDVNAIGLEDDILTPASPAGAYVTSSAGSANLVDFLNAQYAAGAEGGDWIAIRLGSDHANEGNYKFYEIYSGESSYAPEIEIEISTPNE